MIKNYPPQASENEILERSVFFISDGTAITAEVLGHAVLSQFPITITSYTLPFVTNKARAEEIKDQINTLYQQTQIRPLVFYSIISAEVKNIITQSEGFCQDIVQTLVAPLQQEIGLEPKPELHRTHGLSKKKSEPI